MGVQNSIQDQIKEPVGLVRPAGVRRINPLEQCNVLSRNQVFDSKIDNFDKINVETKGSAKKEFALR